MWLRRASTSLGQVDLLGARYQRQRFDRHSHQRFPLGCIVEGALAFRYRGAEVTAPAGVVNLANPGEAHTGQAAGPRGWAYRMFYLEPALLAGVAGQMAGRPRDIPFFQSGVLADPGLAALLRRLHQGLEQGSLTALEVDHLLLACLTRLIRRHADAPPPARPPAACHPAVARARELLEDRFRENLSLADLAREAALSPYHLARLFAAELGLPPHLYLTQVRVRRARGLLEQGLTPAVAALETGFSDQSHLTRRFKALVGVTPGQYRECCAVRPVPGS
ncbi:MAG: AraC family transcriptional regulator [Deltaproteobacteria bacterium]|nr:AraC family transcriptional regulator [Deltaproteobacteria bacterium]